MSLEHRSYRCAKRISRVLFLCAAGASAAFGQTDSPCPDAGAGTIKGIQVHSADAAIAPPDAVVLLRTGTTQIVRKGMPLCGGDHITVQGDAVLMMSLADGDESAADITLNAFASVELNNPHSISVHIGRMFATLRGFFEARTPVARLGAKGTEFQVEVTESGIAVVQLEGDLEVEPTGSFAASETTFHPGILPVSFQTKVPPQKKVSPPKSPTGPPTRLTRLQRLVLVPGQGAAPEIFQADELVVRRVVDENAIAVLRSQPPESSRVVAPTFRSGKERADAYRSARFLTVWAPETKGAFQSLGNVYSDWGQAQKALRSYSKAGTADVSRRERALYYNNLGNAYRLAGSPKEAESALNNAIAADEYFAFPYNGLGDVYLDLAQSANDRDDGKNALDFLEHAKNYYLHSLDRRLEGKESGINRAIPLYHLGEISLLRARWAMEGGSSPNKTDLFEARQSFQQALQNAPQFIFAQVGLGRTWATEALAGERLKEGKQTQDLLARARAEYEVALKQSPKFAPTHEALGESYEQQGDWKAAAQSYLQATEADPEYPLAYYKAGVALEKVGAAGVARNYFGAFLRIESPLLRNGKRADQARRVLSSTGAVASLTGDSIKVPPVVGTSVDDAEDRLKHAGLKKGHVRLEDSSAPRGFIVRQEPKAGDIVKTGTKVDLWRSSGPSAPVIVPSVAGMKSWQAGLALGLLGLRYREEQADSSYEKGKIFRQDPTEGTSVPKGTEITVYVSTGGGESGNDFVTVPRVIGRSWDDAKTEIQRAGFVFELRRGDSPEHSNIVQRQSPDPGSRLPRGSKVIVFID